MFEAAGWHTITVKYGRRLRELFARDGGDALRAADRRDDQRGVPAAAARRRRRAARAPARRAAVTAGASQRLLADLDDAELRRRGPRPRRPRPRRAARGLSARPTRPATARRSIFAYTIKGWRLPTEGHPANHSALLTAEQCVRARRSSSAPTPSDPWAPFDRRLARGRAVRARRRAAAARAGAAARAPAGARRRSAARTPGTGSTQQAFGRFFVDLAHDAPEVATARGHRQPRRRLVDQPRRLDQPGRHLDIGERIDWFADDTETLVHWRESDHGQHIELGIAEVNLVGLLGELGATWSATASRCCRSARSTTRSSSARSSRGRSASTPAGSRSSSARRPASRWRPRAARTSRSSRRRSASSSRGCVAWEPAFGQDLEWTLLHALGAARARRTARRPTSGCRRGRSTRRSRPCPQDPTRASSAGARCSPAATACARAGARPR